MTFRGWPVEALEFYEGLEADNTKSFWLRNKVVYEEKVLAPMQELVAELEPAWGESKIFRPYRDIRFSADKTPYKTSIAAVVGDAYIQLTAHGLGAGLAASQLLSLLPAGFLRSAWHFVTADYVSAAHARGANR